jgi:hypothetical protein
MASGNYTNHTLSPNEMSEMSALLFPVGLVIAAARPLRDGGGCNDERTLALCGAFDTTLLLGRLG